MNILYILGNGFDKAQGMATSYPEFYEYLVNNVKDGSALLDKMKAKITEDTILWSDMESGLGEFTTTTNNAEEFDDFYNNIKKLSAYDTGVTAEFGDEFITLSTCAYHTTNGRFVVVGKRIEE